MGGGDTMGGGWEPRTREHTYIRPCTHAYTRLAVVYLCRSLPSRVAGAAVTTARDHWGLRWACGLAGSGRAAERQVKRFRDSG